MDAIIKISDAVFGAIDAFFAWLPMAPLWILGVTALATVVLILLWPILWPFVMLIFWIIDCIDRAVKPPKKVPKTIDDVCKDIDLENIIVVVHKPESWLSKGLKLYGAYHLLGFGKDKK